MCIYSTPIKNRKYTKTKKNGGVIPTVTDRRTEWIPTKCGNCIECRKQKAREWQIRLLEDIKTNTNGKFITLTFSNKSIKELNEHFIKKKIGINYIYNIKTKEPKEIPTYEIFQIKELKGYEKDNQLATKAIHLFIERWRKKYKKSLRHWLVTELGHKGTENIHLHGIIWTNETLETVEKIWKYGFIWKGYKRYGKIENYVNGATANYISKYINKVDQRNKEYKSIILTSDNIGGNYTNTRNAKRNKFNNKETNQTYKTETGHEVNLPAYWRKKLYTDEERERLWLHKLDQNIKYVDGIKIDTSKNEKAYNEAIIHARRKNHELGYGGKPNKERKEHEELRRDTLNNVRIKNAS